MGWKRLDDACGSCSAENNLCLTILFAIGFARRFHLYHGFRPGGVCSSYGRWIQLDARSNLFLLVAVLDNVQGRGVLQIDTLSAEQVDTDKLREPKTDTDWSPVDLRFPAKALQANESIVVPLQIELRPEKIGSHLWCYVFRLNSLLGTKNWPNPTS